MIFDMGKNLKDNTFNIDGWTTNPCGEIVLAEPEEWVEFTGKFPKKRGRPKMEETFFYDPYEGDKPVFFADVSGAFMGVDVSSIIMSSFGKALVTEVIDNNTLKIKWEITYGTI